jgi:hypothetical protein
MEREKATRKAELLFREQVLYEFCLQIDLFYRAVSAKIELVRKPKQTESAKKMLDQ